MHALIMYSTHRPSDQHVARLCASGPETRVTVARDEAHAIESAADAEVILGHRYLRQVLPHAPALRWVQSTAGGVDRLPLRALADRGVTLSRCSTSSPAIARHALALAWALQRCLPQATQRQRDGVWDNTFEWPAAPRRAIVFGTGSIGRALARRLEREGLEVVGVRQRDGQTPPGFTEVLTTRERWEPRLGAFDWCFLALPHTPQTGGLFDAEVLSRLRSDAVLVNVGRGETLVTADLVRLLREGHLAGAGLDVIWPKPTAQDDPVWRTPRLLITPHIAAHDAERPAQIEAFVERQFDAFLRGRPLEDIVNLQEAAR